MTAATTPEPRVAVVIASTGRPEDLGQICRHLAGQTRPPHRVVLSVAAAADLPAPPAGFPGATVLAGGRGLCAQRNRGLEQVLGDSDVIAFFDDDYVPSRFALAAIAGFFARHPGFVGVTGHLIADGIKSSGISHADAVGLVADYDRSGPASDPPPPADVRGLYGCNMAFRTGAIGDTRFDERLPFYGWQEDVDFSARLLPRGRLGRTDAFAGVHRGAKAGRQSGLRLGYSQIANPLYLLRKGTMRRSQSLRLMARNVLANHLRALSPEPWIDRRGRMRGNWLALGHAVLGKLDPEHIRRL